MVARRVALPESKLKRKRRIKRTRLAILLGVALLFLTGIIIGLSWVPYIRISSFDISGAQTVSTSTLEQFAQGKIAGRIMLVFPKNNIFLYPKKEIRSELLAQYPALREADVHAENFETVKIAVSERKPAALWCGAVPEVSGNCKLMDATGNVYAPDILHDAQQFVRYSVEATSTKGYTSQVKPLQFATPQDFAALVALVASLDDNQKDTTIDSVDIDANDDVHANFSNGFTLIFALKDAGKDVFERFALALASQPFLNKTTNDFAYLDLRFGDKLYYKEKGK